MSSVSTTVVVTPPETITITTDAVQGPTGPTGPTGPAGADGADGADGVGVPAGGTTGQVLAKATATDYDTEWVSPGGLLAMVYHNPAGFQVTTQSSTTPINIDETNLKVTFQVPPSGKVRAVLGGTTAGSSDTQFCFQDDVQAGSPVVVTDFAGYHRNAGPANVPFSVEFLVTGLTPGALLTWYPAVRRRTTGTGYFACGGEFGAAEITIFGVP